MPWRTQVLKISLSNPEPSILSKAISVLLNGGLVIYPTDTVYGLGADPFNIEAVRKVFLAKGRGPQPLPIIIDSIESAYRVAYVTPLAKRLMDRFWPGPLTIVLKAKDIVPREALVGDTIGIRMPNHRVALMLARGIGGLIVGTSANLHGRLPPRNVNEALEQLNGRVDLALDCGEVVHGVPSTVVEAIGDRLRVIREGALKAKALEACES